MYYKKMLIRSYSDDILSKYVRISIGTPEDIGHVYLFLASKEASFISGIVLHANGGAMPM